MEETMALNKETQELLAESVVNYLKICLDLLKKNVEDFELMKKIVKLEELRQSLSSKNTNE